MFSSTSEYALRAIAHLAVHGEDLCATHEIASATRVPSGYLSKIMQDLAKAGLVTAQRGPNGGFALARPPSEISLLDVISAVDPFQRITHCPMGRPDHGLKLCKLHQKLDDTVAYVERSLAAVSMAELMDETRPGVTCAFPVPNVTTAPLMPTIKGRGTAT